MLKISKKDKLIDFTYNEFTYKLNNFLKTNKSSEFLIFPMCHEYCYNIPVFHNGDGETYEVLSLSLYSVTYFDKLVGNPFIRVHYKGTNKPFVEVSTIYTMEELASFIPKDLLIAIYRYVY